MKWNVLAEWPARRRTQVLVRVLADLLFVNVSLIAAFCGWFSYYAVFRRGADLLALRWYYTSLYQLNVALWSVVFVAGFALHGFYTYTRTYRGWERLANVVRAVGGSSLAFLFVSYLLLRTATIPRGVMVAGMLATLLTAGGARMAVLLFRLRYRVERRAAPARRSVGTVLVVGGAGYIGSVLVRRLLERGYHVRVLDCFLYGAEPLQEIAAHPRLEIREGDFRNIATVVEAMRGCDAVVHLAAIVGDIACTVDEQATRQINYAATLLLAEVAKGFQVERFLFASTCSVYGASDEMVDERSGLNPLSLYARTKVDSEKALLSQRSDAFCPVSLRLGTAFGLSPRPRFDLVVNLVSARAVSEGVFTIHNGSQWRPFVHVDDIARAFLACLEAPRSAVSGEIFNIGSTRLNHTLAEVGAAVLAASPGARIECTTGGDTRNYRVSFDKLERALHFQCLRTIADGVREIQEALQSGRIADYRDPRYSNQKFLEHYEPAILSNQPRTALLEKKFAYA